MKEQKRYNTAIYCRLSRINELDRAVLCELVEKITVGEAKEIDGQRTTDITIYYRFVGAVA